MSGRRTFLAWQNLMHDKRRLLLAIGGIGFAVLLMTTQLGFRGGLFDSTLALPEQFDADIVLVHPDRYTISVREKFSRRRLFQAQAIEGVASAEPVYIETKFGLWKYPDAKAGYPIRVVAFDPLHAPLRAAAVRQQAEKLLIPDTVLFDRRSKELFGAPTIGTVVELAGKRVEVVGFFELGTDFADDGHVLTSDRTYRELFLMASGSGADKLGDVDVGLIKVKPGADVRQVHRRLLAALPSDVEIVTFDDFLARELAFWKDATPIGYIFTLMVVMGVIVGMVICYQILYADIDDHMAEFATLKAMGYSGSYFVKVVLQQAVLLSLLGFVPGVLISMVLYVVLADVTGLVMVMTLQRLVLVLTLTIGMCVVSGCLAMRGIFSSDPAELF